jgi:hypothetical protein
MQMLEADLERTGKFVALQVEDIKLRSRALAARAAAATASGELDRIEGAHVRGVPRSLQQQGALLTASVGVHRENTRQPPRTRLRPQPCGWTVSFC